MRSLFVLLFAIVGSLTVWVSAQAVVISPLRYTVSIDPGKQQILTLQVTNNESSAITYVAGIGGVKQDDQGRPVFGEHLDPAEQWITADRATFRLAPKETRKIFYTVAVPAGSEPGTHTAALTIANNAENNQDLGINTRVAALVTLHVAGQVQESVVINQWHVTYQANNKILATNVALFNNGTISVPLTGKVTVATMSGQSASAPLALGNTLLPGSSRHITSTIPLVLAPGRNVVTVSVAFGRSQAVTSATITIWNIPTWWYIVPAAVLMVPYLLRRRGRKK